MKPKTETEMNNDDFKSSYTVAELIAKLQTMNQTARVLVTPWTGSTRERVASECVCVLII
jgi:hypothetical protein